VSAKDLKIYCGGSLSIITNEPLRGWHWAVIKDNTRAAQLLRPVVLVRAPNYKIQGL